MTPMLWKWPESALVGKIVPKSKFYEKAKITKRRKEAFIAEVEQIEWAYKLSSQTLKIRAAGDLTEIQVFRVTAKVGQDVSTGVLEAIDVSVQTPIIFEEVCGEEVRTRAALKERQPNGPKTGLLLEGDWVQQDTPRSHLPQALDLVGLYCQLIDPLLPLPRRPGESMSEVLARIDRVRVLGRNVKALERKLAKEPQLNRKLDIRRELMQRTTEYDTLVAAIPE
jgi:CRP-like cAMP-binding protein